MNIIKFKKKLSLFLINKLLSGTNFFKIKRFIMINSGYKIGKNTKIVGPLLIQSDLEIGDNCWIGRDFKCYGNGKVVIGDNCDIAPNVNIFTGGHKIGNNLRRAGAGESYNITIGNGVWVCANSTLIKSINIGNSSIIAACSCVTKNIDESVIVGGIPAKVIKKI